MVAVAATHIWDDEGLDVITARHVELARAAGRKDTSCRWHSAHVRVISCTPVTWPLRNR